MKSKAIEHHFVNPQALHRQLCEDISSVLVDAIQTRGRASMALSGGSTPKPLFELLSNSTLPWEKVSITLVDERWVDPKSLESNEQLVRSTLLKAKAKKALFIPLKSGHGTALEAESSCQKRLKVLQEPFDIVLLGMGTDGHTASFFPKAERLHEALTTAKDAVAILPPVAPYERMTLTLTRLLKSRHIYLHIEGEAKQKVYKMALEEGPVETLPLRAFFQSNHTSKVEVYYA